MKSSFYRAISLAAIFWTTVSMSAYTPHETGSRTTASGAKAKEGYTCAANFVPIGTVIIYNGHKYVVQDRMNKKYNRHVDIFMESHKKALEFGRREAKVQVITTDEKNVKTEKQVKDQKKSERKKKKQTAAVTENKNINVNQAKSNSTDKRENVDPTIIKTETAQENTKRATDSSETKASTRPHHPPAANVQKPQAKP